VRFETIAAKRRMRKQNFHYLLLSHKLNNTKELFKTICFAKISKNLARYRSENNFVWIIKMII